MSVTTETETLPTLYIRFLRSGLTAKGQVWRRGAVTTIDIDPRDPDSAAVYKVFSRSEPEQRKRWADGAYFEHLTPEQYQEALHGPSVAPEPAIIRPVGGVPPTEQGITRGLDAGVPAAAPTQHTPPTDVTAPAADPEAAAWPWYADADVTTTLGYVAEMGDDEASRFLAYETAHQARQGVLGPMTGS